MTSLHQALKDKNPLSQIQQIIAQNPDSLKEPDNHQNLPIHAACNLGSSVDIIKALVKAYPDGLKAPNQAQQIPLQCALYRYCRQPGYMEVLELLIETYPAGVTYGTGLRYPLLISSRGGSIGEVRLLVERYPDAVEHVGPHGCLPLHYACGSVSFSAEVIRYLVSKYPYAIKCTNAQGYLPIHFICKHSDIREALVPLLQGYPESVHKPTNDGAKTPIDIFIEKNPESNQQNDASLRLLLNSHPNGLTDNTARMQKYRDLNWNSRKNMILLLMRLHARIRNNELINFAQNDALLRIIAQLSERIGDGNDILGSDNFIARNVLYFM